MNYILMLILGGALSALAPAPAQPHEHRETGATEHHADEHDTARVRLSPEQIRRARLKVVVARTESAPTLLRVPGIVRYNAWRMAEITTLTDGVVASRHARLGDQVAADDALLTLRSTALAQIEAEWLKARADYRKNKQEFDRIRPLSRNGVVSRARMQRVASALAASRARMLAARATLAAHGLTERDMKQLEQGKDFGRLTLRAPMAGTVVSDRAVLGQHVAPGDRLMRVANETTLWVEANLPPEHLSELDRNAGATVIMRKRDTRLPASIVTIHHELDQTTRTAVVRLEVGNRQHRLHPGMFVDVELQTGTNGQALTLPAEAVQRQGTEQIVFVETAPGVFERREIEAVPAGARRMRVRSGLKAGERIVTQGAFTLLSELMKSGFEAHQH